MISLPTSQPQKGPDAIKVWRETVFNSVAKFIGIAGSAVYLIFMVLNYQKTSPVLILIYTTAYLLIMTASFVLRMPMMYRVVIFASMVLAIGIFASIENAAIGDGRIWFLLSVFFAVAFLGRRAGLFFVFLVSIIWGILGYLLITSIIPQPDVAQYSFTIWGGTTITLFAVGLAITLTISALLVNLGQNIEKSDALAKKSEEQTQQVEMQKNALERRSNALEASAQISRKIATLTSRKDILKEVPRLLREKFSLNSVSIFLLDTENMLRLASCSGWNEQVQSKHDYILSLDKDIAGMAVLNDRAYSNTDTEIGLEIALPETQSYTVIPLRGRDKILGIFILQSESLSAFGSERISILQMLGDHVAILFENAELLVQRERALEAERRAYGEIAQADWENFIKAQNYAGYRRDKKGLTLTPAKPYHPEEKQIGAEQVPIKIRGKIIGHIDAHKAKNRAWTASEKELLNILASRLETAMDSARLYQDSQQRAERERIISETSARLRETLNIEGVLETAAQELRNALGIAEAEVWIGAEQLTELNNSPVLGKDSNAEKNG